jgi:hypothetical protein
MIMSNLNANNDSVVNTKVEEPAETE